ncbi:hypothetical protein Gogos_010070 [Gossypium gossypioides]|uniref:Uncharacterized protein n=1 Tax=Gossypium gossypioides TaxID=34282 RepID=A0A7J9BK09_GOSGO|nr:hypothetical protein [Gossypium gossypioides]
MVINETYLLSLRPKCLHALKVSRRD